MPAGTLPSPLKALMVDTIYLAYPTGAADVNGRRTYGTPVAAQAHVYEQATTSWSGQSQVRSTATYVCTESVITADTRIWLPGMDSADSTKARMPRGLVQKPKSDTGVLWAHVAEV